MFFFLHFQSRFAASTLFSVLFQSLSAAALSMFILKTKMK